MALRLRRKHYKAFSTDSLWLGIGSVFEHRLVDLRRYARARDMRALRARERTRVIAPARARA